MKDIYDMELWEFNLCIEGYRDRIKEQEKRIIKGAYYTAYFTNGKKIKGLNYYLKAIDESGQKKTKGNNKEQKERLEELKKLYKQVKIMEENENGR